MKRLLVSGLQELNRREVSSEVATINGSSAVCLGDCVGGDEKNLGSGVGADRRLSGNAKTFGQQCRRTPVRNHREQCGANRTGHAHPLRKQILLNTRQKPQGTLLRCPPLRRELARRTQPVWRRRMQSRTDESTAVFKLGILWVKQLGLSGRPLLQPSTNLAKGLSTLFQPPPMLLVGWF